MGTNISEMIFKCSSDQDDIENLVYKWIKDEDSFFDQQSTIHIEFLNNNLILIHNHEIFESAKNNPKLWEKLLLNLKESEWTVFFKCVDSFESYSYIIYQNRKEIRKVIQYQESNLYQTGQPLNCEKSWLNFTIFYERESYTDGYYKTERYEIPDLNDESNPDIQYHKYYYIIEKSLSFYHHYLARALLVEVLQYHLGFDIIDSDYNTSQSLIINCEDIPNFKRTLKQAQEGCIKAQNQLASIYLNGLDVTQNMSLALFWYEKTASQNDPEGELNLGKLYLNGLGIEKNYELGLTWIKKSVKQNYPDAYFTLTELYEKGHIVQKDIQQALIFYKKAANLRHATSAYRLGQIFELGQGVTLDLKLAKRFYHQAASNFSSEAKNRLDILDQLTNK